jgi:hypothetical protein
VIKFFQIHNATHPLALVALPAADWAAETIPNGGSMINAKNLVGAAASLGLLTSATAGLALGDEALHAMVHSRGAANAAVGEDSSYIIDWSAAADASVEGSETEDLNANLGAAVDAGISNPDEAEFMGGVRLGSKAVIGSEDGLDALLDIGLNFGLGVADPDD